jgi:hypothetical protein
LPPWHIIYNISKAVIYDIWNNKSCNMWYVKGCQLKAVCCFIPKVQNMQNMHKYGKTRKIVNYFEQIDNVDKQNSCWTWDWSYGTFNIVARGHYHSSPFSLEAPIHVMGGSIPYQDLSVRQFVASFQKCTID